MARLLSPPTDEDSVVVFLPRNGARTPRRPRSVLASPFASRREPRPTSPQISTTTVHPLDITPSPPVAARPRPRPPSRPRAAPLTGPAPAPPPSPAAHAKMSSVRYRPQQPLLPPADRCCITDTQQDAQEEEFQEGDPVLPHGLRRLGHRPHHLRQHALWPASPHPQGLGRPLIGPHRRGRQDQAHHRRCVAPRLSSPCPRHLIHPLARLLTPTPRA